MNYSLILSCQYSQNHLWNPHRKTLWKTICNYKQKWKEGRWVKSEIKKIKCNDPKRIRGQKIIVMLISNFGGVFYIYLIFIKRRRPSVTLRLRWLQYQLIHKNYSTSYMALIQTRNSSDKGNFLAIYEEFHKELNNSDIQVHLQAAFLFRAYKIHPGVKVFLWYKRSALRSGKVSGKFALIRT